MRSFQPFTMTNYHFEYGPNTPFSVDDREAIEEIYSWVANSENPEGVELRKAMENQVEALEELGEIFSRYPSPVSQQRLGHRERDLDSLTRSLCQTNPANFEFFIPTQAILGRALDRAEANFYRLLRHICDLLDDGNQAEALREKATERLHVCLYTIVVEDVLTSLVSDDRLDNAIRSGAVSSLIHIWDRRLTYKVSEFFPLLEDTWKARQRIKVIGGTLLGTQEMFELFREGCDPRFVEYFTRPNPSQDEVEAFREFLFGTTSEDLSELEREMSESGIESISLSQRKRNTTYDAGTLFYEFFRSRFIQASARRLANLPGPKRTAEGYVMIAYLSQSTILYG
ncbi:MAG: hypothetical protein KC940_01165 [Candidatus Omnitrophica bacterium]|nr:hypothetical protein [Candidatus Omnitrophota bacterium]